MSNDGINLDYISELSEKCLTLWEICHPDSS